MQESHNHKLDTVQTSTPMGWMEVVLITTIVVTILGIGVIYSLRHFPSFTSSILPERNEKTLFLDTERIIDAKMAQLREVVKTPGSDINGQGVAFGKDLAALIQSYADRGYIVLNSRYVVACPKDLDITEEVAEVLKVQLLASTSKPTALGN